MKKIIFVFLVVFLSSCGSDNSIQQNTVPVTNNTPAITTDVTNNDENVTEVTVTKDFVLQSPIIDNKAIISLPGYTLNCTNPLKISQLINETWEEKNTLLPVKGSFFLDEEIGYNGSCDIPSCKQFDRPVEIELVEYTQGESQVDPHNSELILPSYTSKVLNGEIKINYDFYTDSNCTKKTTYEEIVVNDK